ncbi:uncharacterized protein EDB91DRAFT_1246739 [Suillus paluster]|uniref:uncharacterized protein n=1 Tax=Suillus paluster TaxID=48578 RepID=UPI001B87B021|nr:uncharacterized protein EDB91DRAFT_1246739 [Suillus paluster]KAG1744624.1 hypothetical protein EDB91DRAFT_1246739 [Suillus paluster]
MLPLPLPPPLPLPLTPSPSLPASPTTLPLPTPSLLPLLLISSLNTVPGVSYPTSLSESKPCFLNPAPASNVSPTENAGLTDSIPVHHQSCMPPRCLPPHCCLPQSATGPNKITNKWDKTGSLFRAAQPRLAFTPVLYASATSHTMSTSARASSSGTTRHQPPAEEAQRDASSTPKAYNCATTGNAPMVAQAPARTTSTIALDVEARIMALKSVLEARKLSALTPYHANA